MDEKRPVGRPTKYKPEYCEKIIEYFDVKPYIQRTKTIRQKDGSVSEIEEDYPNDLPTLAGFSVSIDVDRDTLKEWAKVHPDFSAAYKKAKAMQYDFLVTNGMRGLTVPSFTIFAAKNIMYWRDKQPGEEDKTVTLSDLRNKSDAELDDELQNLEEEIND